jgi:hypothetical protein
MVNLVVVCPATRRRWFVYGAALALHVTHCTGQIVSNVKDCSSSDAGALATTETKCMPPRKNLNPDVRYFKVPSPHHRQIETERKPTHSSLEP